MRITVFRRLMTEEFGGIRAETLMSDHVISSLDGKTPEQALEAGIPAKDIWRAVCEDFDVPRDRR